MKDKKLTVIFDLDNTLADISHRTRYLIPEQNNGKKEYQKFLWACPEDRPLIEVIDLFNHSVGLGLDPYIFSGRNDEVKHLTVEWLIKYKVKFSEDRLFLRKENDYRKAFAVKSDWLQEILPTSKVLCAIDDEPLNAEFFTSQGIITFHPQESDLYNKFNNCYKSFFGESNKNKVSL